MPATTFEVGAVFILEDRVTPALLEIGRAFERLTELANTLRQRLATVGEAAFTGLMQATEKATTILNDQIVKVDQLAAAYDRVATAAKAAATEGDVSGAGGRRMGGYGYPAPFRVPRGDEPEPPGSTIFGTAGERADAEWENRNRDQIYRNQRMLAERENADIAAARAERDRQMATRGAMAGGVLAGAWPLIGGLGAIGAEKKAMEEDAALAQTLNALGFSQLKDPERFKGLMEELKTKVVEGTQGTIFSEAKGAIALPRAAGEFGAVFATPEERFEALKAFLPGALRFGEVGQLYGLGGLEENLRKAAVPYAHMTGRYGGEPGSEQQKNLQRGLDELFFLSQATGESLEAQQSIMKYSVPIGLAAGMGPDETAALTGFFQILGFRGTTAATGLGQLLFGLTQTGGPVAAHLQTQERSFVDALKLKPEDLRIQPGKEKPHIRALKDLGIISETTGELNPEVAPEGKLAWRPYFEHIEDFLRTHTKMQGLEVLRNLATVRGARLAAELTPDVIPRLLTFMETSLHPRSTEDLQRESQMRPLSQFEQMLANIANIGNTLATETLKPLNTAFQTMNTYLIGFNEWLKQHQTVSEALGFGSLSIAAAGAAGLAGAGARWMWRNTGARALWRGARGLMSSAEAGADLLGADLLGEGGAAAADIGAGIGGLSVAGVALPILLGTGAVAGMASLPYYRRHPEAQPSEDIGWWTQPSPFLPSQSLPGPRAGAAMSQQPAAAAPQSPNVTVTIGTITVPPEMQSWYEATAKMLMDAIKSGVEHATEQPAGTALSPYAYPGWTP